MSQPNSLRNYVRQRLRRGLSINGLGPNEARIVFDFVTAAGAAAAAGLFHFLFVPAPLLGAIHLVALPFALVGLNAVFGVYSTLKRARIRTKALTVIVATLCVGMFAWGLGISLDVVVLWGILTGASGTLARFFSGLPYSKHRDLVLLAANQRGPVLVIGGAGYIGSATVDLLLKEGYHVRVLDRLMYGRESLAQFMNNPAFELVDGDVTDITKLTFAARNAIAVVHLAGLVGDPACSLDPIYTRHANVVATRMAKDVALSLGVSRFIFASSCSVYGASEKEVKETAELNPVSLYAQSKIDSEKELLWNPPDGFYVTVLRFATVFGHSLRPRFDLVANLFTAQAMTNGLITVTGAEQWRPFVHVADLARAIVAVLKAAPETVQSQVFNVGDQRMNMTIHQLAEKVRQVTSAYRNVEISVSDNPQDRRNYAVSFDKIRQTLGFEATMLMEGGVAEIAAKLHAGAYQDYRNSIYSNVQTTRDAVANFYSADEMNHLYGPLAERKVLGSHA